MNPGAPLSRLSLPIVYGAGGARPFRALSAQRRLQGRDETGSTAGFNPLKRVFAKSTANAVASVKRVPLIQSYSPPCGERESKNPAGSSEEGSPAELRPPSPRPRFEEMAAERILKYCEDEGCGLQTSEAMAMVQRLYDIALFEHDVTEPGVEKALEWIEALKRDIDAAPARDEKAFSQFEEDCASAVETASRIGRGSLLWKLAEDRVPDNQIAEYITKPEHRILMHTYLQVTGPRVGKLKPILILNLVKQPLCPGVRDPVVTLHALAMGGDPALAALFNAAEFHAFVNVPDDYDPARLILVNAGVNVGRNPLNTLRSPRNLSAIPGIVNTMIVRRSHNDQSYARMAALQPDVMAFFKFIFVILRYSLAWRILSQYYVNNTGEALLQQLKSKDLQTAINRFDALEAGLANQKCAPSIVHQSLRGLIEGYWPEPNAFLQLQRGHEIEVGVQLICVERAQFIDDLHKNLQSWTY
jgi:hypothetical protein